MRRRRRSWRSMGREESWAWARAGANRTQRDMARRSVLVVNSRAAVLRWESHWSPSEEVREDGLPGGAFRVVVEPGLEDVLHVGGVARDCHACAPRKGRPKCTSGRCRGRRALVEALAVLHQPREASHHRPNPGPTQTSPPQEAEPYKVRRRRRHTRQCPRLHSTPTTYVCINVIWR